jgi:hypothetical protein
LRDDPVLAGSGLMKTETHADPGLEKFERFKREGVMSALYLIDAAKLELRAFPVLKESGGIPFGANL